MTMVNIVVDDKDDEPDELDDEVDDDLDEDDPDDDDDDLDEDDPDDAAPDDSANGKKPTYKDLLEEVKRLRQGNQRNNRELMTRRHLASFMQTHKIENLDTWLQSIGVDPATGLEVPGDPAPAATETPGTPDPGVDNPPTPEGAPEGGEAVTQRIAEEVNRRVALELAKREAQENPSPPDDDAPPDRAKVLEDKAKHREVELALSKVGFTGTFERAMKVLDLSGVQVDEAGNVSGAEAAVQDLREEIPEWFRRTPTARPDPVPPTRRGAEAVDGGDKRRPAEKKARWEEKVADQWSRGQ